MSEKKLFRLVGMKFYKPVSNEIRNNHIVTLTKDKDNKWDNYAIMVSYNGVQVGWVGNSEKTVPEDGLSATDIYEWFGESASAVVTYRDPYGAWLELIKTNAQAWDLLKKRKRIKMTTS